MTCTMVVPENVTCPEPNDRRFSINQLGAAATSRDEEGGIHEVIFLMSCHTIRIATSLQPVAGVMTNGPRKKVQDVSCTDKHTDKCTVTCTDKHTDKCTVTCTDKHTINAQFPLFNIIYMMFYFPPLHGHVVVLSV